MQDNAIINNSATPMTYSGVLPASSKTDYLLHLADSTLVIAQRNAAWCGHGPILEQDIALTNITLDLLGQARNFYQYAAALTGNDATEDTLAYLRTDREFKNLLLTEQPNGHWGQTVLRQFFFSAYLLLLYAKLQDNGDDQLSAIAAKSLKEVIYHNRWSSEWVIRLGDGTSQSHARMEEALENLWPYTNEFFIPAAYETRDVLGFDLSELREAWQSNVKSVFERAGLSLPNNGHMHSGGKEGMHTEHLGYILAEMQYLQRVYPGATW